MKNLIINLAYILIATIATIVIVSLNHFLGNASYPLEEYIIFLLFLILCKVYNKN